MLTENACTIYEATNHSRGDFYTMVLNYCKYDFDKIVEEGNMNLNYKKQEIGFLTRYLKDVGKSAIEECKELNLSIRKPAVEDEEMQR